MPSAGEWFWSSELGRDNLLRNEIEGLQASAYRARDQSARLSSQLNRLQGSIETRLSALSAAFDAYVELGDVREQLAGYPDTSAARRDAIDAIETLSRGGTPDPVPDRGLDYWLPWAVNATITLLAGAPDRAAEERAVQLSPEAEWFIVAAAGALGAGPAVAARVASLLVCDGQLSGRQVAVWRAVLDGVYPGRLPEVGRGGAAALDQSPAHWVEWVRQQSRSVTAVEGLRWLDAPTTALAAGPASPDPASPAPAGLDAARDRRAGLRQVVIDLVGRGMGEEAALLDRARLLRAKIEDPVGTVIGNAAADPVGLGVVAEVQAALLDPGLSLDARREIWGWVRPGLSAAIAQLTAEVGMFAPATIALRTEGGDIEVVASGADPARVARAETTIAQLNGSPPRRTVTPAAIGAALAVLALLSAVTAHPGGAVALLVGSVVAGGVALVMARDARQRQQAAQSAIGGLRRDVAAAQQRAQTLDQAQGTGAETGRQTAETVRRRIDLLAAP